MGAATTASSCSLLAPAVSIPARLPRGSKAFAPIQTRTTPRRSGSGRLATHSRPRPDRPVAAAAAAAAAEAGTEQLDGTTLARKIEEAFEDVFFGSTAAPRVLDSFHGLMQGREHVQHHPGLGLQVSESYIEGLSATPFPDLHSGKYKWLEAIEANADLIKKEFDEVTADPSLEQKGENVWVPAAREEAFSYGPDWRTLVLQDRGIWDPTNSRLFPKTTKLISDLKAPTLEVFFARQVAGTGIKSHTDYVNFIQTSHLGLDVPEGDCWIKVGDLTRNWENGKVIICETSFMHETQNNTDKDRVVLIMRHFHPEVTPIERKAVQFLFDCLENPTHDGIRAARRKALASVVGGSGKKGGGKKKGGADRKSGSGGRGFG